MTSVRAIPTVKGLGFFYMGRCDISEEQALWYNAIFPVPSSVILVHHADSDMLFMVYVNHADV